MADPNESRTAIVIFSFLIATFSQTGLFLSPWAKSWKIGYQLDLRLDAAALGDETIAPLLQADVFRPDARLFRANPTAQRLSDFNIDQADGHPV